MKEIKNILLVSGSGRNCGKTTLVCNIISSLSKGNSKVLGLKISPHFHIMDEKQLLSHKEEGINIYEEKNPNSEKDSGRMLKAGAKKVYFIQCDDKLLEQAYIKFTEFISSDDLVICESGSLSNIYKPGLHILVRGDNFDAKKKSFINNLAKADLIVRQSSFGVNKLSNELVNIIEQWKQKNYNYDIA